MQNLKFLSKVTYIYISVCFWTGAGDDEKRHYHRIFQEKGFWDVQVPVLLKAYLRIKIQLVRSRGRGGLHVFLAVIVTLQTWNLGMPVRPVQFFRSQNLLFTCAVHWLWSQLFCFKQSLVLQPRLSSDLSSKDWGPSIGTWRQFSFLKTLVSSLLLASEPNLHL